MRSRLFIRGKLLVQLGGFHELLGLGTELKGGEDTEFVHRAFHRSNGRALCIPGYLVGHHTADASKKAQYYEGALAAILAHRRASPAARIALARKLMVGIAGLSEAACRFQTICAPFRRRCCTLPLFEADRRLG